MSDVVFFDATSRDAYDLDDLGRRALGGTESTVIRIAESLDALVLQAARSTNRGRYRMVDGQISPRHVVSLRSAQTAAAALARFPHATHTLWLHDLCTPRTAEGQALIQHAGALASGRVSVICVSRFHLAQVRRLLKGTDGIASDFIYNPVARPSVGAPTRDPGKLVFFSSPHKGLSHALRVFHYARLRDAGFTLHIANPGYNATAWLDMPGVVNLGSLPQVDVLHHVSTALCTFYPNFSYPETFGLVMAESQALGTPVLTHAVGAAPEILAVAAQMMPIPWADIWTERLHRRFLAGGQECRGRCLPARLFSSYRDRLLAWAGGSAPRVHAPAATTPDAVAARWRALLS